MALYSYALCTLDDVKEYYQYPAKGSRVLDNDLLEDLINYNTDLFHKYCGWEQFKSKTYTEYQDGIGINSLYVYNYPIISVTSIHDDVNWSYGADTLIDSSSYKIVDEKYIVLKDTTFMKGTQNIKIVYVAGYATIPGDLKKACIKEVVRDFKNRKNFDELFKTVDGDQVTKVEAGLMKSTTDVLDKYVRLEIC